MLTSGGNQPPFTARPPGGRSTASHLAFGGLFLACVALAFICLALAPYSAKAAAPATTVSLTFDDGNADQMQAVPIMKQYGINGTFYTISGVIGAPNYMTRSDLNTIAAAGNEIGGHTVTHPDLTTVSSDEAARQICNGRVTLTNWGFRVTSFAYPYAALNPSVEAIVKNCGFNSARSLGDIKSAHSEPGVTDVSGAIPPTDPYNLPAVDEIDNTWTLAQMEAVVTSAEKVGGSVIFTFHHICSGTGCDSLSITPANFTSFVAWLKTRPATTSVKTIDSVIGGNVQPAVAGPPVTPRTTLANPSLETPGIAPFPQCWMPAGWGTNTATWTRTTDAHSGSFAQGLSITGYASGDAKLLPTFDLGDCSPAATPGTTYNLGTWYKSTGTTQFALYYRDSLGAWYYWTSSPWFAPASNWTQATWTTPAAPAGATGMSFGLALISNGSLTTDDYTLAPSGGAATNLVATNFAARGSLSPSGPAPNPGHTTMPGRAKPPATPGGSKSATTQGSVVIQVPPVTVDLNRGMTANVSLKCKAALQSNYCTGKLALTIKGQTVTKPFRIKTRKTARIAVNLPTRARAAAAGKNHPTLHAKLKISTNQARGPARITWGTLTIKTATTRGSVVIRPGTRVPLPGRGLKQGTRVAIPFQFGD